MESWPVKPKAMDEHAWYRAIEKTITLTVISADEEPGKCPACGFKTLLFQCQTYPDRKSRCFCKMCAIEAAGGPEFLWVRTEAYLQQKWIRNGKDPAKAAAMRARRLRKPDRVTCASGTAERR